MFAKLTRDLISNKRLLLLDMNNTFMFGEDRFSDDEDFSIYYHSINGSLPSDSINTMVREVYAFLDDKYPKAEYRQNFPTLNEALSSLYPNFDDELEIQKFIQCFSHHEMGYISDDYVETLKSLSEQFKMALYADLWSPKKAWEHLFEALEIRHFFSALSVSSDHGFVKPSPHPIWRLIELLSVERYDCLLVGDSVRRDLGAAINAGVDCVLIGQETDSRAVAHYNTLHDFVADI